MEDTQANPYLSRISPRLVVGLGVMIFGILLTLENLGVFEIRGLWRYWPLVFILVGISKFVQGADAFGALIWVGAGASLVAANFGLLHLRQVWPLFLVVVGARLVFGALGRSHGGGSRPFGSSAVVDTAHAIDAFAFMGGVARGTNSTTFERAAASAFMGGCVIDLRRARIAKEEAVFDAFAMWGGVEVKVPEDWAVENRGVAILGGFVDSTRRPTEPKGRLVLTGLAVMGGVEVKN